MPNDDTANAVISYLKSIKVPPNTFPTTGQDATLTGLQNVLSGYQCGTVYKPIYLEAQAAAALGSVPARGREAAGRSGQRIDDGHQGEQEGRLGAPEADLGDAERTWPRPSSRTASSRPPSSAAATWRKSARRTAFPDGVSP